MDAMEFPSGDRVGRPLKFKLEYCQKLIDHMSAGYSFESFAGVVSVCKETLYVWEKSVPEFLDAKRIAFQKCRLFWESQAINNLMTSKEGSLHAPIWIFNMKNRFGWADKVEIAGHSDKPLKLSYNLSDEKIDSEKDESGS